MVFIKYIFVVYGLGSKLLILVMYTILFIGGSQILLVFFVVHGFDGAPPFVVNRVQFVAHGILFVVIGKPCATNSIPCATDSALL
jgi:hypothetical protein